MKNIDWKLIKGLLGFLFFVFIVSTCTYSVVQSNKNAERICSQTEYFKVINKDFVNRSNNILSDDYHFVMYFERYDKNKSLIESTCGLNRINITKYEYDIIEVGKMYHKSKINIKTYGFN